MAGVGVEAMVCVCVRQLKGNDPGGGKGEGMCVKVMVMARVHM